MNIESLISQLQLRNVTVEQDIVSEDGFRTLVFSSLLPSVPFGRNKFRFAALSLEKGQTEVDKAETAALCRRLCHLGMEDEIFGLDPEDEDLLSSDDNNR